MNSASRTCNRFALLMLLAPSLLLRAPAARADDGAPSPFHEILVADDLNRFGTSRLWGHCDLEAGSKFHFGATGAAFGPYPCTFVEHGKFSLSPAVPVSETQVVITVTSFTARFRIDSEAAIITGSKTIVPAESNRGYCGNLVMADSPDNAAFMRADVTYSARVETRPAAGEEAQVACYSGTGFVQYGDTQLRGIPDLQEFAFAEPFITSTPASCEEEGDGDADVD